MSEPVPTAIELRFQFRGQTWGKIIENDLNDEHLEQQIAMVLSSARRMFEKTTVNFGQGKN